MNPRPEESAYEREFAVRYRLPRPLSRSYESILYARDPAEIRNKIEWCAATAVRFIAALRQALYLTTDFSTPAGPPGTHDFKLETDLKAFRPLASMPPPVLLLRHAGMYTGPVDRDSRASLLDALEPAAFLCRYRIACRERDGFRVLLGQRVEYVIWTDSLAGEIDEGTPILVDTENGDYLSLGPLAVWRRYNGRADSENRLKELGRQFGIRGLCCHKFWATEAAHLLAILGHNLCALLQRELGKLEKMELATLRMRLFTQAAVWSRAQGRPTLQLAVPAPLREWWIQLIEKLLCPLPPLNVY